MVSCSGSLPLSNLNGRLPLPHHRWAVALVPAAKTVAIRYRAILQLPIAFGACQEPSILQKQLEVAPATGLSDGFRACVMHEVPSVVQRVSSRGQVALMARHEEMNRDVAAACDSRGHSLRPDEISYIAREIDKEVEAKRSAGSIRP
jgi:hypothetical protein